VRLGVELVRAQQAMAPPPALAPTINTLADLRATIALMNDMHLLTPAPARSSSSGAAEFQAAIDKLVAAVKAGPATEAAAPAQGPQPAVVVIGGRCIMIDAAAAE